MKPGSIPVESPASKPRYRRLLLELGAAGLGYALLSRCQASDLLKDGAAAPDFTTVDLDGRRVSLSDFADAPLLLHFWTTWCGICRQEFGALRALHQELTHTPETAAPGLAPRPRLLTLAGDDDVAVVRAFVAEHALPYPVALASPTLLRLYKVQAFPTSYYIDPAQRISAGTVGMSSRWAMKTRLSCAAR